MRLLQRLRVTLILFPSPCGEEVMKLENLSYLADCNFKFPSPCGEEVMKYAPRFSTVATIQSGGVFPSPCGEEVMKSRPSKA